MPLLENKVCVITGGAGSIGLASARLFLKEGAKVMLVDLQEVGLDKALASLSSGNADAVAADVGDASATRGYIERSGEVLQCLVVPTEFGRNHAHQFFGKARIWLILQYFKEERPCLREAPLLHMVHCCRKRTLDVEFHVTPHPA